MSTFPRPQPLHIVTAGAGSGKTYAIQHQLGEWVEGGVVRPERIIAVTYTEAAAGELRQRISARLVELGRVEDALKLAQAYITTIHGFGLRVLTEFAFEAGASPSPRLLEEDEQGTLVRRALARTDKADAVADDLEAFGYRYNWASQKGASDMFREDLLEVLQLYRSIGLTGAGRARRHAAAAVAEIADRYGKIGSGRALRLDLQMRAGALLRRFPQSLASHFGGSKTARQQFRRDFMNLKDAAEGSRLRHDWKLWQQLRSLRTTKKDKLPPDYLDQAADVMRAANRLQEHPGPLRQACRLVTALLTAGQDILEHYEEAKRTAGLVDYTDMIAMAERLLRSRPDVLATLKGRVDCLVVDEFQDTNPLQFSLLWTLTEAGIPTFVVGDLKQAIMGFQGADPRLFRALRDGNLEQASELDRNWRSQPRLMDFINAVGPVLFDDDYTPLEAQAPESKLAPLEFVVFKKSPWPKAHAVRALSVGQRLKELLDDPRQMVTDRASGAARRMRGGDIAVLCQTHNMLSIYAHVLRKSGLRVNYDEPGWLESRPVQIAWHALSYIANPADRHAALYLAVTELGSLTLEEGLRQLMDTAGVEDPVLRKLDALAEDVADRTVYALVADMLATLRLFDRVATWPDSEQARANLVHLMGKASEFMDASREALAHGGFHGSGVPTFLAWLSASAARDDVQPDRKVVEEDAIQLRTWHSSKGLEWPVVVVAGMGRNFQPALPEMNLDYESFDDLSRVLKDVAIEYWPRYDAPEKNFESRIHLAGDVLEGARRLLYVALTRAREKLVLEWPTYLNSKLRKEHGKYRSTDAWLWRMPEALQWVARARPYYWLLWGECNVRITKEGAFCSVHAGDRKPRKRFDCHVHYGLKKLPDEFMLGGGETQGAERLPEYGRRAIRPGALPGNLTPDSRAPSSLAGTREDRPAAEPRAERYGRGLRLEAGLRGRELGTFLHRCFEILGSRPDLAERIPELTGVDAASSDIAAIRDAALQFEAWLASWVQARRVLREWPLMTVDAAGTVMSGTADLVVETADGCWILDHKSDRVENPAESFQKYRPQLDAYARALRAAGSRVLGAGIHWIRRGEVMWDVALGGRARTARPGR